MNSFQFINSKDIRNHLENINYEFSSLETAWLIFQCRHISLQDKFRYWEQLIEEMPDCEIPERSNCVYRKSLHEFLKQYIGILTQQYKKFCESEDNAVYRYRYFSKDDCSWCEEYDSVFKNEKDCWKEIEDDIDLGIERIMIRKDYFGAGSKYVVVEYNNHEVMYIDSYILTEEESSVIYDSFEGMWFDFPVPFQKGDIVIEKTLPSPKERIAENGAFVLTGVTPWKNDEVKQHIIKNGDNSDMNAWGYFQEEDGRIFNEVMFNYMDLELYEGPLTGKIRLLKALSEYEKGNIDIILLLSTYRKIIIDEFANDVMLDSWFLEDQLKNFGFESDENRTNQGDNIER